MFAKSTDRVGSYSRCIGQSSCIRYEILWVCIEYTVSASVEIYFITVQRMHYYNKDSISM